MHGQQNIKNITTVATVQFVYLSDKISASFSERNKFCASSWLILINKSMIELTPRSPVPTAALLNNQISQVWLRRSDW